MIPVAVHMLPLDSPPMKGCVVVGRASVGTFSACASAQVERLQLRTRNGRLIRFGKLPGQYSVEYESVAVSPNGKWLLLQADLTCDSRGAFVVPVTGGTPRTVPRLGQGCDGSQGHAIGWTPDNRAIVDLEPEQCRCSLRAGIYAFRP